MPYSEIMYDFLSCSVYLHSMSVMEGFVTDISRDLPVLSSPGDDAE